MTSAELIQFIKGYCKGSIAAVSDSESDLFNIIPHFTPILEQIAKYEHSSVSKQINKAIPEDKQEKKLLTDNKTAPNAEWETIKKNASRSVYPGDAYITHIS